MKKYPIAVAAALIAGAALAGVPHAKRSVSAGARNEAASAAPAGPDPIPTARKYDWTYTGVPGGIPNRKTICKTLSDGTTLAEINNAISLCPSGQAVFLKPGSYNVTGQVNINKSGVTLRGAGANQTRFTGDVKFALGNFVSTAPLGTGVTGGGTKGSKTITVASPANLYVGAVIEIDRADPAGLVNGPAPLNGRNIIQVNAITGVSGNVLTLRNPLFSDFTQENGAQVKDYYPAAMTSQAGLEDIGVNKSAASNPTAVINGCDSCWIKGVESSNIASYHVIAYGALNVELRDSFIHDGASGPNNSGFNAYGNFKYGVNSNFRIENNIFNKNFPAIEVNNDTSGIYVGYNFAYGSVDQYGVNLVTWTFDDGHAPFNVMNLYEGNVGEMFGADNYYGGTAFGTAHRNYFSGWNRNYNVYGNAIWLDAFAYHYNLVGNVLGSSQSNPNAYAGCGDTAIYRLGYPNLGNCATTRWDSFVNAAHNGGYPDPQVADTLMRWGNYDYFNKATQWNASELGGVSAPPDQLLAKSYVYNGAPSWWKSGVPFPPIGPDVKGGDGDTSGHVYKIPAQLCWENSNLLASGAAGGAFNAETCFH